MIKRTTTETIEKFDIDGHRIEKTTRTEEEVDDTNYTPSYPSYQPYQWQGLPREVKCKDISTGTIRLDNSDRSLD